MTIITYGTFDLFHYGHLELLKNAKCLGNKLIVGLSTDEFNLKEKNKKSVHSFQKRKENLESIKYVDLVIPEESWDQKIIDIQKYKIDVFTIGEDWIGHFDELMEFCDVKYLPRTPDISSTLLKAIGFIDKK